MSPPPFPFVWSCDRNAFYPKRGFEERADKSYVDGQIYILAPVEHRSKPSHDQQFAYIEELWGNLPEDIAGQFPTPDHLRKHALIMTGHCHVSRKHFSTPKDAVMAAALLTEAPKDDYELVTVDGHYVTRARAKSQSYRAMGKAEFQKSKADAIAWIEDLIGINKENVA